MILNLAAAIVAGQLGAGMDVIDTRPPAETVQYRRPVRCGHGADRDIRDGRCYPTGTVPPQFQAGRQYGRQYYGGRYPVRCGHGADRDVRDGLCYPTGTVPPQFQSGRLYPPEYDDEEYYERPRRRRYY
jgi:hypothetical protein